LYLFIFSCHPVEPGSSSKAGQPTYHKYLYQSHIRFTMPLSQDVIQNLKKTVDNACADPKSDIPGTSIVVVDKNGKEIFAHAAGKRGVNSSEDMTLDNVFWIASCTKMIAGVAVMQLVEQGKLHLDDGDEIEKLIPELKDIKVLQKDGKLVEKNKKITLRMLLTHTGTSVRRCGSNLLTQHQLASVTRSSTMSCVTSPLRLGSTNSRATSETSCNH
jgi:CubicO group peptidase (beta-lactamase class C family)